MKMNDTHEFWFVDVATFLREETGEEQPLEMWESRIEPVDRKHESDFMNSIEFNGTAVEKTKGSNEPRSQSLGDQWVRSRGGSEIQDLHLAG